MVMVGLLVLLLVLLVLLRVVLTRGLLVLLREVLVVVELLRLRGPSGTRWRTGTMRRVALDRHWKHTVQALRREPKRRGGDGLAGLGGRGGLEVVLLRLLLLLLLVGERVGRNMGGSRPGLEARARLLNRPTRRQTRPGLQGLFASAGLLLGRARGKLSL